MSLINCLECGKEISDSAERCIYCGAKTELALQKREKMKRLIIALIIIAVVVLIALSIKSSIDAANEAKLIAWGDTGW